MIKPLSITLAIAAAFPQLSYAEEELARVVVTGSNIRTSQKEGASAVQVLTALVDALRATSARTLEAAPSAELLAILREAGFAPGPDGREVMEL